MISKISYLSFPGPGRYVWNYQTFGSDELVSVEIEAVQMRRILQMGLDMMLRESFFPVPVKEEEATLERTGS